MNRFLCALAVFLLTLAILIQPALSLPTNSDEVEYAFISAYYGGKIIRGDISPEHGDNQRLDPGWTPVTYWTLTQPMGPRYAYAVALGLTQAPPPGPDSLRNDGSITEWNPHLPVQTRNVMRFTAILLSALGLAMIAFRLGWPGLVAAVLFLTIPHVPADLARGWAEGPLLFGFGLCAVTWGSSWFAPTCGLAALMKLNALPLWLLAFHVGLGGSRLRSFLGLGAAWLTWTVLELPAWFLHGPLYLVDMLWTRWFEYRVQNGTTHLLEYSGLFGYPVPSRYLWPVELGVLLAVCLITVLLRHQLSLFGRHESGPAAG